MKATRCSKIVFYVISDNDIKQSYTYKPYPSYLLCVGWTLPTTTERRTSSRWARFRLRRLYTAYNYSVM